MSGILLAAEQPMTLDEEMWDVLDILLMDHFR